MTKPILTELSPTHIRVLQLLANGESQKEVMAALYYSHESAVRSNLRIIKRILKARNIHHAIYIATKKELI